MNYFASPAPCPPISVPDALVLHEPEVQREVPGPEPGGRRPAADLRSEPQRRPRDAPEARPLWDIRVEAVVAVQGQQLARGREGEGRAFSNRGAKDFVFQSFNSFINQNAIFKILNRIKIIFKEFFNWTN